MTENAVLSPVVRTHENEIAHTHGSFDDEANLFDLDIKIFIEDVKTNNPVMQTDQGSNCCPCDYSGSCPVTNTCYCSGTNCPPSWCNCGPTYGQC